MGVAKFITIADGGSMLYLNCLQELFMADRVHPLSEEIDGRLRYDHAGNLFYNEYKPLLDKLYYKVGTETNKEDL